jgi:hypothetical protein
VSFGTYARKVRDSSLANGRRLNALAGCVQRYSPIGFMATFGYLEHVAGRFRHDEAALLRAVDGLTSSRDLWLAEVGAYATRRKEAKRLGQRSPHATDTGPSGSVWYGDRRNAGLFALRFQLRRMEKRPQTTGRQADPDVLGLASACVESNGRLDDTQRELLHGLRHRFEELREVSGWPQVNWPEWHKANDSLWLLHLISEASL